MSQTAAPKSGTDRALANALRAAHGAAFDGCHKIYVLADETSMQEMIEAGYGEGGSVLIVFDENTDRGQVFDTIKGWYEQSCFLRFISVVSADGEYRDVIGQGRKWRR